MSTFSRDALSAALARMSTDPRPNEDPQGLYRSMEGCGDQVVDGAAKMIVYLRMQATGHALTDNPSYAFLCHSLILAGYRFSALLLGLAPRARIPALEAQMESLHFEWQAVGLDIQREWFAPDAEEPADDEDKWDDDEDEDEDDDEDFLAISDGWMPHNDLAIHVNWCVRALTQEILEANGIELRSTNEAVDSRMALGLLGFNDGIVLACADWTLFVTGRR